MCKCNIHDDVIKRKNFTCYWPFVRFVNSTLRNRLKWSFNQNTSSIHENASQYVVCEMVAILSRSRWVNCSANCVFLIYIFHLLCIASTNYERYSHAKKKQYQKYFSVTQIIAVCPWYEFNKTYDVCNDGVVSTCYAHKPPIEEKLHDVINRHVSINNV